MNARRRAAFTLVELLVVIAIIGILIALLLPAVQAAREAARRTQCLDQLKQMGIACQTYATAKKTLPPGKNVFQSTCGTPPHYSNWAIEILPYIEELGLFRQYHFDSQNYDNSGTNPNQAVTQTLLPIMHCPSDPNNQELAIPQPVGGSTQYATGSYRGVAGRGYGDIDGAGNGNAFWDSNQMFVKPGEMRLTDKGPLTIVALSAQPGNAAATPTQCPDHTAFVKSAVKMSQIIDGTSKTMLIGEYTTTTQPAAGVSRSAFWALSYYGLNLGSITVMKAYQTNPTVDMSFMSPEIDPDYNKCTTAMGTVPGMIRSDQPCNRAFTGVHSGGGYINFVFCDGSTHIISANTDIRLLSDLATIAGGENRMIP